MNRRRQMKDNSVSVRDVPPTDNEHRSSATPDIEIIWERDQEMELIDTKLEPEEVEVEEDDPEHLSYPNLKLLIDDDTPKEWHYLYIDYLITN